jgi:hypothetical protein
MPDQFGRMTQSEMLTDLANKLGQAKTTSIPNVPPQSYTPRQNNSSFPSADDIIAYLENDESFNKGQPESWNQNTPNTSTSQPQQSRTIREPSGSFGSNGQWQKPAGYNQYPQWAKDVIHPDSIPRTIASYARKGLNIAAPVGLIADAFNGEDRLDRKVGNIVGNVIGGVIGAKSGNSGAGALAGGWVSDRILDVFDDNDGKNAKPATQLLNQHLSKDPIMQIAMYEEQLRQSRLQQKEMERQMMAMARMQAQVPQSSYSQAISGRTLPTFTNNGTMVNPYESMGGVSYAS